MAKKGTFYRWRLVFSFPGGASGTDHQLESFDHAVREAANLLFRGADVDIVEIDEATRERRVLHDLRACDFDFPTEDDDLGGYDYPIDVARDMVHERVYGKPTDRAVRMAQQALEAAPSAEEARQATQAFTEALSASQTTDAPQGLTLRVVPVYEAALKASAGSTAPEPLPQPEEKPMDKIWIILREDDEFGHLVWDADGSVTATVTPEDACAAFNAALSSAVTITVDQVPMEAEKTLGVNGVVLCCLGVQRDVHRAQLRARLAQLDKERALIEEQLAKELTAKDAEAARIREDLERQAPWNA